MSLESCVDYEIIKEHLSEKQLEELSNIIEHYVWYINEYDNGTNDVIGEYMEEYGNYLIIDWYEGIITTEEFLDQIEMGYFNEE